MASVAPKPIRKVKVQNPVVDLDGTRPLLDILVLCGSQRSALRVLTSCVECSCVNVFRR